MATLSYISIREQNTKEDPSASLKEEIGELIPFIEGGISIKYKFVPSSGRVTKLIKIYDGTDTPKKLKFLKTLMDEGIRGFRYSPIVHALPIGYNLNSKLFEESHAGRKPFLVFVFKDNCINLQEVIMKDDYQALLERKCSFDYHGRFLLGKKLFELYLSLENIQRSFPQCRQVQILHYDIKPENYIFEKTNNEIYIVDLDQSGAYDITNDCFLFKPTANLRIYDTLFLPYEVFMNKGDSEVKSDDPIYWKQKERFTEIWMAWLLIFRVMTGFENPFFFSTSQNHKKVYELIKSKAITDLFSLEAFEKGDVFNSLELSRRKEYISSMYSHYDRALSADIKMMMNEVFIKGFFVFNLRPSFFSLNQKYSFTKKFKM